jgi:putative PIN family toxin of toxin-antitoxin system
MDREKFDRYLDRPLREEFVALIRHNSHLFSIEDIALTSIEPSCRDLKDNKFLALALAAETELLVSSDEDLLVLSPWRQIRIVTPSEFLARSGASVQAEENI